MAALTNGHEGNIGLDKQFPNLIIKKKNELKEQ